MANGKAALLAVPFASVVAALVKIRGRQDPASEESQITSLSLDDADGSTKRIPVDPDDKRSQ
jgi:hypothetical protein